MKFGQRYISLLCIVIVFLAMVSGNIFAQQNNSEKGFSLQVTPSPIVETIKPGIAKVSELKIRNTGTATETLKMELQSFRYNQEIGEVELLDEVPADVKDWVTFSNPEFTVNSGTVFNQKINISTPIDVGFGYYFAITIKRASATVPASGQQALEGTVAVFTLLSVDRPDAKRSFDIIEFSSKKRVYEYLPAEFSLTVKNTGNTIARPSGSVFIQRTSQSSEPITVLPANPNSSFVLPNTSRILGIEWQEGFPVFEAVKEADNVDAKKKLSWNFSRANDFRIGKYVAKVVAIYNDGQRDIPVQAEISFWVIPWKILLGILLLATLVIVGLTTITRRILKVSRHKKTKQPTTENSQANDQDT